MGTANQLTNEDIKSILNGKSSKSDDNSSGNIILILIGITVVSLFFIKNYKPIQYSIIVVLAILYIFMQNKSSFGQSDDIVILNGTDKNIKTGMGVIASKSELIINKSDIAKIAPIGIEITGTYYYPTKQTNDNCNQYNIFNNKQKIDDEDTYVIRIASLDCSYCSQKFNNSDKNYMFDGTYMCDNYNFSKKCNVCNLNITGDIPDDYIYNNTNDNLTFAELQYSQDNTTGIIDYATVTPVDGSSNITLNSFEKMSIKDTTRTFPPINNIVNKSFRMINNNIIIGTKKGIFITPDSTKDELFFKVISGFDITNDAIDI